MLCWKHYQEQGCILVHYFLHIISSSNAFFIMSRTSILLFTSSVPGKSTLLIISNSVIWSRTLRKQFFHCISQCIWLHLARDGWSFEFPSWSVYFQSFCSLLVTCNTASLQRIGNLPENSAFAQSNFSAGLEILKSPFLASSLLLTDWLSWIC